MQPKIDLDLLRLLAEYDELLDQLQDSMKLGFSTVSRSKFFYTNTGATNYASESYNGVEEKFHDGLELRPLVTVDSSFEKLHIKDAATECEQGEKAELEKQNVCEEIIENAELKKDEQESVLRSRAKNTSDTVELQQVASQGKLIKEDSKKKNSNTSKKSSILEKRQKFLTKLKYDPVMVYNQGDLFGSSSSGNKLKVLKQAQSEFCESLEIMVKLQQLKFKIDKKLMTNGC